MGVFSSELTDPLARVLARLGSEHAMVVHGQFGDGGIDELSTLGPTQISHVTGGQVETEEVDPQSLDLPVGKIGPMLVDSPEGSAAVIRSVLAGEPGPPRDIVCLNAAAALVVADLASDLRQGLDLARKAVDSGAAAGALDALVKVTEADPTPQD
jgi:anthranilate phosphoribosyltransferase